jgi:hypothetical protein
MHFLCTVFPGHEPNNPKAKLFSFKFVSPFSELLDEGDFLAAHFGSKPKR